MTTPARTYDEAQLSPVAVTSLVFARTYARLLLRDKPDVQGGGLPSALNQPVAAARSSWPEFSRSDVELNMALSLDSVTSTGGEVPVVYYRPHVTAARLYLGDPNLWQSRSVDGSSERRRDASEIVSAWLAGGAALDRLIPLELHPLPSMEVDTPPSDPDEYVSSIPLIVTGL